MKYKSKYKQFDITTGVIYNKAARILKEEYSDVQEQIDNYMNNCKEVLPEISKFKKNKVFFSKGSKLIDKVKNIANNIYSNIGEELDIERVNLVEEFEIDEEQENYDLREIKENIEMFKEGYRIYLEIQAEKSEGKMVKSFRDRIKGWLLKDEFALPESKDK